MIDELLTHLPAAPERGEVFPVRTGAERGFALGRDVLTNEAVSRLSLAVRTGQRSIGPARPVTELSWLAARVVARLVGGRLPRQEEWEAAARRLGVFGVRPSFRTANLPGTWPDLLPRPGTVSVDDSRLEQGPGFRQCRQMIGNVREWCEDGPKEHPEQRWTLGGSFSLADPGASESYTAVRADVGVRVAYDESVERGAGMQTKRMSAGLNGQDDLVLCVWGSDQSPRAWERHLADAHGLPPEEVRALSLPEVSVPTLPLGWHRKGPLDQAYWQQLWQELREAMDKVATGGPRRVHLFYNGPFGLGAVLGCGLRERLERRGTEIIFYQFDQPSKRWQVWGHGLPIEEGGPPLFSLEEGGAPDAQDLIVTVNIIQRNDPRMLDLGIPGKPAWAILQSSSPNLDIGLGERGAAELDRHLRELAARFPHATIHLIYSGPQAVLSRAAMRFDLRRLVIYEFVDGSRFVSSVAFPGPQLRVPNLHLLFDGKLRILLLADEWAPHRGGISTFNRDLCLELARAGHMVYALIPPNNLHDEDRKEAKEGGVQLVSSSKEDQSQDAEFALKPILPAAPHVIIGHGMITGRQAEVQRSEHFPDALLVYLVHVAPGDTERVKGRPLWEGDANAEQKEEQQVRVAAKADLIVALGPVLREKMIDSLHAHGHPPEVSRIDPWLQDRLGRASGPPPSGSRAALLIGRMRDHKLKGFDIAVDALGRLEKWQRQLVVRGVTKDDGEEFAEIRQNETRFEIRGQPYSVEPGKIEKSFRSCHVVLMPSRSEGFGLVGLEAISFGVPVLVSEKSGLGHYLYHEHGTKHGKAAVVRVSQDPMEAARCWADRIEQIWQHPAGAFDDARALREELLPKLTAARSIDTLIAAIRVAQEARRRK